MISVCSLFSGSSGNSIFISCDGRNLLIDAGVSGKSIRDALTRIGESSNHLSAILITHEHGDHIRGAGILARKHGIPIYANQATWDAMRTEIGVMDASMIRVFTTGEQFVHDGIAILPFSIPHDAVDPVGFSLLHAEKKVTVATDIGHINKELLAHLENSDMLLLESNHDIEMLKVGRYPWHLKQRILGKSGHLCNEMAGKVVAYLAVQGTRQFLLGHLSKENNFPELAYQTVKNALQEKEMSPGSDVRLEVALRDRVSSMFHVG